MAATFQAVPSPRTPERRNGPCRVPAPYLTRSGDGKGRGGRGTRSTTRYDDRRLLLTRRSSRFTTKRTPKGVCGRGRSRTPQERVQRHTVEHIVDFVRFAPMVGIFGAPVSQMVEQLLDIIHFFDTLSPDPEQVIEVPTEHLLLNPSKTPAATCI